MSVPSLNIDEEHESLLEHQSSKSISHRRWIRKLTPCAMIVILLLIVIALLALYEKDVTDVRRRLAATEDSQPLSARNNTQLLSDSIGDSVIHVTTIIAGAEFAGRVEVWIKSMLIFHAGIVHIHLFADARAAEVLSMLFQTLRIERLRWSLYDLERAHNLVDFIPTLHRAGNTGYLRLFAHDLLPRYVEKAILMDVDTIILEDIAVLHSYFGKLEAQGAFFGASRDMYRRYRIRLKLPYKDQGINVGVVLLNLQRMRQTNWDDLWRNETIRLLHEFGPPTASEQDTFASLEYSHPPWCYRLPCGYNFQLGEWTEPDSVCLGESLDYDRIKIPHWTGNEKWASKKTSARHFTRLYQCIQMIDWTAISGAETDRSMAPARTLLFMREGAMTNSNAITLSVSTPFEKSFAVIDRAREWPGAVDVVVVGSDRQQMLMRNFLSGQKTKIGARISVHFVHRPSGIAKDLLIRYLHKLSADISRTEFLLLTFDIEALDISQESYAQLKVGATDRFTAIYSTGEQEIGLLTSKKHAQRFSAEGTTLRETAIAMKLPLTNFTSAQPSDLPRTIIPVKQEYPPLEFCRLELGKRKPKVDLIF